MTFNDFMDNPELFETRLNKGYLLIHIKDSDEYIGTINLEQRVFTSFKEVVNLDQIQYESIKFRYYEC